MSPRDLSFSVERARTRPRGGKDGTRARARCRRRVPDRKQIRYIDGAVGWTDGGRLYLSGLRVTD